MTVTAPAPTTGAARGPWIASVALALAILVAVALAVVTLLRVPTAPSSTARPAPAPASSAAPAPAPAPTPAGAPALTDTGGRALPATVATGVQGLYTALGTGDLPSVRARYAPSAAFDAAPWPRVAPLLAQPAAREQLLAALREPPQRRSGIYRYAAGEAVVGVNGQGRMAFVLVP